MKIQPSKKSLGSTMIATAILAVFIAGFVAVYLLMVSNEYTATARSQSWNQAMSVAEAGIEDALQLVNINASDYTKTPQWTNSVGLWDTNTQAAYRTLTWTTNGATTTWHFTNAPIYHIRRALDPAGTRYYDVYINNSVNKTNKGPEILSIGTVNTDVRSVSRKVYIETKLASMIKGNLVSLTNTVFNGNGVTIDSFDSADPYHSDWQTNITYKGSNFYGTYPTNPMTPSSISAPDHDTEPYMRKDNGQVATLGLSVTVQNANVAGYVNTAPGGTAYIQNNGIVGAVDYVFNADGTIKSANANSIQAGHIVDDMETQIPPWPLPKTQEGTTNLITWTNLAMTAHTKGPKAVTNYLILKPGYYAITNDINGKNNNTTDPIGVDIDCAATNAFLWLPTGIKFSTGDTLTVESNCNLTVYVGTDTGTGTEVILGGLGSINNYSRYALVLKIYGLMSCSKIDFGGPSAVTAFIYAPQAELDMGGGGSDTYDAVGAFFAGTINFGGHINFHYDEQLQNAGPSKGYVTKSWKEVQ
jgi:hypothetical protein